MPQPMPKTLIAILLGFAGLAAAADQGTAPGIASDDDHRIGLAELPQPVRDAIQREAGNLDIGEITRHVDEGRIVYEVRITQEGPDRRLQVSAEGEVIPGHDHGGEVKEQGKEAWDDTKEAGAKAWDATKETSQEAWQSTKEVTGSAWERSRQALDDDGLTLDTVPAPVKAAFLRAAAGQEITDIDVEATHGRIFYQAEVRVPDARNRVITVDADGKAPDGKAPDGKAPDGK